jgi:LPS-assembly protein
MIFRSRILITAMLVCHLLLAPRIVTSQTPPTAAPAVMPLPAAPSNQTGEEVEIHAVEQEKDGLTYKLRGQAEIRYRSYILKADAVTYDSSSGETQLEGHVILDGGPYDEHVEASHGTYNIQSETGTFYDVIGTAGFRIRRSRYVLTTSNPFAFTGKVVEKHGPGHYLVRQGTVTTCELPRPKWKFDAQRIVVDVDGSAKIYNSSFELRGVPVFYFPFATHPVQKQQRQSGLLIPSMGKSSSKGVMAGESVYWAINRSMDATMGGEYYSRRGWSQRGEFRARPSDTSFVDLSYYGVIDRGIGSPLQKQGGEDVRLNGEGQFGNNFRGVANIDYLSSFVFRIAFNEVYTQAVNSEVKSQVFLSNTTNGFNYNALAERYQNFEICGPNTEPACPTLQQTELIQILHTPSFLLSSVERQLGETPLYWSFDSRTEGLQVRELGFRTAPLVGRFDLSPSLSMPLQWQGWSIRPELTLRDTFYTQRFDPSTGKAQDEAVNRKALEAAFDLRPPALSRVYQRPWRGRQWKHVIEPRIRYDYVTGVNNFAEILRFDARDLLSNTNEIEYGVVNRLYAKRTNPGTEDCAQPGTSSLTIAGAAPPSADPWEAPANPESKPCSTGPREIVSWELAQKYFFDPTFGHALVTGQRNVFTSTADFTGIAFLSGLRNFSPVISRLRIETSPRTNTEWDLDFDTKTGRLNASTLLANYHSGLFTIGAGDTFLRVADAALGTTVPGASDFHQLRILFGYGNLQKRGFSGATSFGFDANQGFLQYSSVQTSYNWDCCGLSVEYRRFALGLVRNENQFRFAFSLANVGAFGNLRRQERLY